jgi:hypothetical protein
MAGSRLNGEEFHQLMIRRLNEDYDTRFYRVDNGRAIGDIYDLSEGIYRIEIIRRNPNSLPDDDPNYEGEVLHEIVEVEITPDFLSNGNMLLARHFQIAHDEERHRRIADVQRLQDQAMAAPVRRSEGVHDVARALLFDDDEASTGRKSRPSRKRSRSARSRKRSRSARSRKRSRSARSRKRSRSTRSRARTSRRRPARR